MLPDSYTATGADPRCHIIDDGCQFCLRRLGHPTRPLAQQLPLRPGQALSRVILLYCSHDECIGVPELISSGDLMGIA